MFDFRHPFFEPLWIRLATAGLLVGWGLFEFYTDAPMWGFLFCALGVAAGYQFFFAKDNPPGD